MASLTFMLTEVTRRPALAACTGPRSDGFELIQPGRTATTDLAFRARLRVTPDIRAAGEPWRPRRGLAWFFVAGVNFPCTVGP